MHLPPANGGGLLTPARCWPPASRPANNELERTCPSSVVKIAFTSFMSFFLLVRSRRSARPRSRLAEDEVDGFYEPFGEGGIGLDGGLEAVPGFEDGGGAGVELVGGVGGEGFADLGGIGAL